MTDSQVFDQLTSILRSQGVDAALSRLADELRSSNQFHELFEVLKMQVRRAVGVPLTYSDHGDDLSAEIRNRLEDGLLHACREVGLLLLRQGRVREGWMYLRPVGDRQLVAQELKAIAVDDDNVNELVEVLVQEGVDVARGYALVLKNYGTCNAITTFDATVARHSKKDQQDAAGLLVDHVHSELLLSLRADISRQEGSEPSEPTIRELVADRPWLFSEFSYHLDTTHLASTVRVARMLENRDQLAKALDMTEYGRRLSSQFQYKGDEPFLDIYPSHALFLNAILGNQVDEAIAYFRTKAETVSMYEHGSGAVETYVQLLARTGQSGTAVRELLRLIPDDSRPAGFSSLLMELSNQAHDFQPLMDYCRNKNDLLGYATGLLMQA